MSLVIKYHACEKILGITTNSWDFQYGSILHSDNVYDLSQRTFVIWLTSSFKSPMPKVHIGRLLSSQCCYSHSVESEMRVGNEDVGIMSPSSLSLPKNLSVVQ